MMYRPRIDVKAGAGKSLTLEYETISFDDGKIGPRIVSVCREDTIQLSVNGHTIVRQTMTPDNLAEFACGYLISEGIVSGLAQIESVSISFPRIEVAVTGLDEQALLRPRETAASGGEVYCADPMEDRKKLNSEISVHRDTIFSSMMCLNDYAVLWRETGGAHCTVLFDSAGGVVAHAEDIGRHNSVDKAIGLAFLTGVDTSRTFITCSGRMPAGMVRKVWHSGIPIAVTNNAPSAEGIDLAREVHMTLAGFVRPPRMILYSAAERIRL